MRRALILGVLIACSNGSNGTQDGGNDAAIAESGADSIDANADSNVDGMTPCNIVPDVLPEGDTGIAAKHPGDVAIETDPCAIFADGFEDDSTAADLLKRWDNSFQNNLIRFATEPGNFYAGQKALEFTVPQMNTELANGVDKIVKPERDLLFLRYYSKFIDRKSTRLNSSHRL